MIGSKGIRSCELLSFIVSLLFENSPRSRRSFRPTLWIAFIYRIFALWKQRNNTESLASVSCELLSFIVSLLFENSDSEQTTSFMTVVNCFHLSYLCSLKTARSRRSYTRLLLWIAFIYRIFALWKQPSTSSGPRWPSCELLSFIVSLLFENSGLSQKRFCRIVVNCFHLSYLCSLKTAVLWVWGNWAKLWIAFIYRIFALWKQQRSKMVILLLRCELLSFIVSLLFENSDGR